MNRSIEANWNFFVRTLPKLIINELRTMEIVYFTCSTVDDTKQRKLYKQRQIK